MVWLCHDLHFEQAYIYIFVIGGSAYPSLLKEKSLGLILFWDFYAVLEMVPSGIKFTTWVVWDLIAASLWYKFLVPVEYH
jgi:hypothetical protein